MDRIFYFLMGIALGMNLCNAIRGLKDGDGEKKKSEAEHG